MMSAGLKGLIISYAFLIGIVVLGEAIRVMMHLRSEFTRKFIHVGVGFWGLVAYWTLASKWIALIPPASFILINIVSYRWSVLKSMEIEDKANLGTVYYPLSICVLLLLFWEGDGRTAAVAGLMIMALGDGFASIVGQKWGTHRYRIWKRARSWEGTMAMFVFSWAAVILVCLVTTQDTAGVILLRGLILAACASVIEAISPWGTDNLTVPLLCGSLYRFLS